MSHFAEINSDGVVQRVIVAEQDFINSGAVGDSFNWVQTSYNNNFRKQYAGIGSIYDPVKDKFLSQQPYASWSLDSSDDWQAPITYPTVTNDGKAGTEEDPNEWVYIISWNETKYNANNTQGWEATKSNDESETPTKYNWNGTAWVSE